MGMGRRGIHILHDGRKENEDETENQTELNTENQKGIGGVAIAIAKRNERKYNRNWQNK